MFECPNCNSLHRLKMDAEMCCGPTFTDEELYNHLLENDYTIKMKPVKEYKAQIKLNKKGKVAP